MHRENNNQGLQVVQEHGKMGLIRRMKGQQADHGSSLRDPSDLDGHRAQRTKLQWVVWWNQAQICHKHLI